MSRASTPPVQSAGASAFTLVTLNMAKETRPAEILHEFLAVPEIAKADVLLMQEVSHSAGGRCVAEQIAEDLGMRIAYSPAATGVTDQGVAILSRFPLHDVRTRALPRYDLVFHTRSRIVLSATLDTPAGPVRVSNAHLDTRVNAPERVAQLTPVLDDGFPGPRIVAGDFNSNNFYWLAHLMPIPYPSAQTAAVRDFMLSRGFTDALPASTPTFDHLGMHLDWVFSKGLHARAARALPLEFSDHHAVWVDLGH